MSEQNSVVLGSSPTQANFLYIANSNNPLVFNNPYIYIYIYIHICIFKFQIYILKYINQPETGIDWYVIRNYYSKQWWIQFHFLKMLWSTMQCTITLSLFILRLRVVVCQDTSKMHARRGWKKPGLFSLFLWHYLPFVRKSKASLLGILQNGVTLKHFVTWHGSYTTRTNLLPMQMPWW